MDIIHLPLLPANTRLIVALTAMRWLQKKAVVREEGDDLNLVGAGKVVHGLAHQKSLLSEVQSKSPVLRITAPYATQWGLDVIDPGKTWAEYEQFLDQHNVQYGLIETVPGVALVVTRHEGLAGAASGSPGACFCDGDGEHEYNPPPGPPEVCYCGEKIECYPPLP